ncbi:mannonate dehydratase [Virgibacillus sp. W0430]|uniref:mannonate dehydratase n=1 Tax=Virgibacillus sp. W0430 TaxID=3391580 RepID=UPI003F45F56D
MKMSFRWYGEGDEVTLENIKQIPGMKGIVSAIYDIPVGEVWSETAIKKLVQSIEDKNLELTVIESVPVHEDIKLGRSTRDKWISNYKQTLRNLSNAGIEVVCYNFMPVFDWTRTNLHAPLPDGSNSLLFDAKSTNDVDLFNGEFILPGWDISYQEDELRSVVDQYKEISEKKLMNNLIYFLKEVIPVAEEENIVMAIHPDDPPWPIFGLPRVVTNLENVKNILSEVDSPNNGITFCTGSYGANPDINLIQFIKEVSERIHFVHARNIKRLGNGSFQETSHLSRDGEIDMVGVINTLIESGYNGPIRPDHGRMIWGETGRPGYGLYDRALGATYLNGIIDTVKSINNIR